MRFARQTKESSDEELASNRDRARWYGASLRIRLGRAGPAGHSHDETFSAGEPGGPKKPARILHVTMQEHDGICGLNEPGRDAEASARADCFARCLPYRHTMGGAPVFLLGGISRGDYGHKTLGVLSEWKTRNRDSKIVGVKSVEILAGKTAFG